jgi:hypothetical protein
MGWKVQWYVFKSCSIDTFWSLLGVYDHHQKITSYNVAKKKPYDWMTKFLLFFWCEDFLNIECLANLLLQWDKKTETTAWPASHWGTVVVPSKVQRRNLLSTSRSFCNQNQLHCPIYARCLIPSHQGENLSHHWVCFLHNKKKIPQNQRVSHKVSFFFFFFFLGGFHHH